MHFAVEVNEREGQRHVERRAPVRAGRALAALERRQQVHERRRVLLLELAHEALAEDLPEEQLELLVHTLRVNRER